MTKRPKYNARKTLCPHGHMHDSKLEADRCHDLHMLQRAGEITALSVHPQFWFSINGVQIKHANGRRVGMKPDFQYFEGDTNVVEDAKGFRTADYVLRVAIFRALYPYIDFREVTR